MKFQALLRDPGSINFKQAEVELKDSLITVSCDDKFLSYPLKELNFETPVGKLPLFVRLPDGYLLEVVQSAETKEFLNTVLPSHSKFIQFLEQNLKATLAALAFICLLLFLFFKYSVPVISNFASTLVPMKYLERFDSFLIEQVTNQAGKSELSEKRKKELDNYFHGKTDRDFEIIFVKGNQLKANAFALSGKTIIFTDEIVELIDDKKKLLGIFFHELGHLEQRHVAKNIISSAVVSTFAFLALGDIQGIAASIGSVGFHFLTLKHSQDFEIAADKFSVEKLTDKGISRSCFIEALEDLSNFYKKDQQTRFMHYFSSHPHTMKRVELIEERFERQNRLPCNF